MIGWIFLSTLSLLLCQSHKTSVTVQLIDFVFINSKFSFFCVVRSCEVSLVESKVFKSYNNLYVHNLCCVLCFMQNEFFVVSLHSLSLCVCLVFCLAFLTYKNKCIVRNIVFKKHSKEVSSFPGQIISYTNKWDGMLIHLSALRCQEPFQRRFM